MYTAPQNPYIYRCVHTVQRSTLDIWCARTPFAFAIKMRHSTKKNTLPNTEKTPHIVYAHRTQHKTREANSILCVARRRDAKSRALRTELCSSESAALAERCAMCIVYNVTQPMRTPHAIYALRCVCRVAHVLRITEIPRQTLQSSAALRSVDDNKTGHKCK